MGDTKLNDYPARLGGKQLVVVDHVGPSSYTSGGETIGVENSMTGITAQGLGAIDLIVGSGSSSASGTYSVQAKPAGVGSRKTVYLKWLYNSGIKGVTSIADVIGTSPTNGTYTITATTGVGKIQIVVSGGAITSTTILNPGVYTTTPTFTPPSGLGTGATITATIGSTAGNEVASGADLSAETVRLGYIGR